MTEKKIFLKYCAKCSKGLRVLQQVCSAPETSQLRHSSAEAAVCFLDQHKSIRRNRRRKLLPGVSSHSYDLGPGKFAPSAWDRLEVSLEKVKTSFPQWRAHFVSQSNTMSGVFSCRVHRWSMFPNLVNRKSQKSFFFHALYLFFLGNTSSTVFFYDYGLMKLCDAQYRSALEKIREPLLRCSPTHYY